MSEQLIRRLRHIYADGDPITEEAADLIEAQQNQINVLTTTLNEVCAGHQIADNIQLAAAQAQIKVLRDALENAHEFIGDSVESYNEAKLRIEALAQPSDDSALREMLKAERERCAKVCEEIDVAAFGGDRPAPNDCADAIRAMEDES